MCGIAGFIGDGNVDNLHKMIGAIGHRGPDNTGVYFQDGIAFAHARLSILDTSGAANQPFFSADKSHVMIFNGEIFNYESLRTKLQQTGRYTFTTTSDTEVVLNLYLEYGIDFLQMLNGMFAIAIYEFNSKKLFLARDRMGKKPFYYSVNNNTILFASELKAILTHPASPKNINTNVLSDYLTLDYCSGHSSIISGINKLKPGHYLIYDGQKEIKEERFWKYNFNKNNSINFSDAQNQLDNLLDDAVKSRLVSDVPLGVFLSGGLDSSAVAYYAQKNAITKIKTFSIGFEDASYDETEYSKLVANHLGTDHYHQVFSSDTAISLIPHVYSMLDEPFADPSIIPTYYLSKYTKQHVTVALGGDGSDELFAGYPTFISDRLIALYKISPRFVFDLIQKTANKLIKVSDNNISSDFKINQLLKGFRTNNADYIHTLWLSSFGANEKRKLLNADIQNKLDLSSIYSVDECLQNTKANSRLDKVFDVYYNTYLLDDILFKVDRASMMTSLEVRAPFMDYRIVEFANSLPYAYKMKFLNGKYILKEVMRNKLPDEIIDRPKKGFGIPVSKWLRNELHDLMNDLLSKKQLNKHGLFNSTYVMQLMDDHVSMKKNNRKELWNLMCFQQWYNNYVAK